MSKRIDHKLMSLVCNCYESMALECLQELIPRYIPARSLRSASQPRLRIANVAAPPPHTHTHTHTQKCGFRASFFFLLCPQALECPITNDQETRFLSVVLQMSKKSLVFCLSFLFQCLLDSLRAVTFLSCQDFFYLFSFSLKKEIPSVQ